MLGQVIQYQGRAWRVIEYLQEQRAWVLQAESGAATIQPDQFGDARRKVPETRLITAESDPQLYSLVESDGNPLPDQPLNKA